MTLSSVDEVTSIGYFFLGKRRSGPLQSTIRQANAARIAREIHLPVATIAEAIGKKAPSVRKHPDASSLQPELRRVYRIWAALVELHSGNKKSARIFLNAPNKHLENQAPVEFIQKGDLKPLEGLVEAMQERQPQ